MTFDFRLSGLCQFNTLAFGPANGTRVIDLLLPSVAPEARRCHEAPAGVAEGKRIIGDWCQPGVAQAPDRISVPRRSRQRAICVGYADAIPASYAEASQVDRAFDRSVDAAELEGLEADAVIECSGSESGMRGALAAARPEGTIVVVGSGHAGLDPLTILVKELRVQGCFTYVDEFTEVISLLTDGGLQVADLTSEIAGIDDAPAAFERLRDASTMKIFIAPNGS